MLPTEEQTASHPARKILIIHSGGIGDMLLALPAMRVFRRYFPGSSLDLMGRPARLSLISRDLGAASILSVDRAGMAYFYADGAPLPPDLSAYFAGIDAVLLFAKGGGDSLARNLRRAGAKKVLQIPPFPEERVSVYRYYLSELSKAGITGEVDLSPLRLSEEDRAPAAEFWARHNVRNGSKILAIHPGSGSRAKNWAAQNFAAMVDWAAGCAEIFLISGPAEEGSGEIQRLITRARPIIADGLPLVQLAALLDDCSAYLGNDSGITHLAAFAGVPTVALFGPTDSAVWAPAGPDVHIIQSAGGPEDGLKLISPVSVIEVLARYLRN